MAAISIVLPEEVPPTSGVCTTRVVATAAGRACSQCGHSADSLPRPVSRVAGSRRPQPHTCHRAPYRPGRSSAWRAGQPGQRCTASGTGA